MNSFAGLGSQCRDELFNNILPFWLSNSNDEDHGGFFTCLDRRGKVYDTDKFLWLQSRQVWLFSYLFNHAGENDQWLGFAFHGSAFLQKHGRDEDGSWFFSLDRTGRPLIGAHSIFTDLFAALGFGSLYKATEIDEFANITISTFSNALDRRSNPKGRYSKAVAGTRPLFSSSVPMIVLMVLNEIGWMLNKSEEQQLAEECLDELLTNFYHSDSGLLLENVGYNGSFSNSFEGRLICGGTICEGMWFIMDRAALNGDQRVIDKASEIVLRAVEFAWDTDYGGLFYFQDLLGNPPQQLEWDQKLWWVHAEALIALLKAYDYTGRKEFWNWFLKVHDYTWSHFPDPKYGEWFGYLNRRGEVLLDLKGGKWKGCYHIPRMLYQCWRTFERLAAKVPLSTNS